MVTSPSRPARSRTTAPCDSYVLSTADASDSRLTSHDDESRHDAISASRSHASCWLVRAARSCSPGPATAKPGTRTHPCTTKRDDRVELTTRNRPGLSAPTPPSPPRPLPAGLPRFRSAPLAVCSGSSATLSPPARAVAYVESRTFSCTYCAVEYCRIETAHVCATMAFYLLDHHSQEPHDPPRHRL